ncbi:MAG TPA: IPT/TIG domain-containing protein, partial [Polyangiales bacterium]|nr:IPT/TIG domain-containing protein [Polyangiales bacterium]
IAIAPFAPITSRVDFSVTERLADIIARPAEGPVDGEVVLRGRGFSPIAIDDRVELSGKSVVVTSAAASELHLRVPDAPSGPFVVQVGDARVQTRDPFIVTHPPRIHGVSAATIAVGESFEVKGDGFGSSAALVRVSLGARSLTVISVRDDRIEVRAPSETMSGQLSVRVALQGGALYPTPIRISAAPTPDSRAAR